MNASTLFNDFASAKNFSKVGNRVTSTQPGKPFASAEALNYIPVGYNTSGGNMFRYGSLAAGVSKTLKSNLGRNLSSGEKAIVSSELREGRGLAHITNLLKDVNMGPVKQSSSVNGTTIMKDVDVRLNRNMRNELIQERRQGSQIPRNAMPGKAAPGRGGGAMSAYEIPKDMSDPAVRYKSNTSRRISANQKNLPKPQPAPQGPAVSSYTPPNSVQSAAARKYSEQVKVAAAEAAQRMDRAALDAQKRAVNGPFQAMFAGVGTSKSVLNPKPKPNIAQQENKLGMGGFDGANAWFKGIQGKSKYAFAAAGGVAALTAGGITLSQIQGSKHSPVGAAMVMGGVAGLGAVGAKYGARGILGGVLGGKIKSSSAMRGTMKSTLNNIGNMNMKTIGTVAGVGAAAGLGLGVTRNVTGI